jgi:Protein of unknown function (DUF2911)
VDLNEEATMAFSVMFLAALVAGGLRLPPARTGAPPADTACWVRGARADLATRPSPLDSAVARLGAAELKVCYGRPSARGRVIMGGLVPFDRPWRLGANEATTLHLPVAAVLGDVTLEPGVYSLYAVPGRQTWQLVVNDWAQRWGIPIGQEVRAHDVGTIAAHSEPLATPVDTLTIRFQSAGTDALTLVIEWEKTRVAVPLRRVAG